MTYDGLQIVKDPHYIYDSSSKAKRENKTLNLSAGFGLYSSRASISAFINPDTLFSLFYHRQKDYLNSNALMCGLGVRSFVSQGIYFELGLAIR